MLRTTDRAIIDFNPSEEFHWIYDDLITRDDADFFQTTYKDNPFLEPEVIEEIERLKETDSNYWRIYGLGMRGLSQSVIFSEWQQMEIPEDAKLVAIGLDWGFTNDPSAVVAVYKLEHSLYFDELLYSTGLTNPDLARMLTELIPERAVMKRHKLHATPRSLNLIKELRNYKWKTDKNDRQLNQPVDSMNHTIDAIRYVCLNKLTKSHSGTYHIR